jgi:2'-hydroxyisoflavone reductase
MSQSRRTFLQTTGLATAGLAISGLVPAKAAAAPKRLLIIGGTSFLGPAIVEAAQQQGMVVTLFNRGKTNPGMFPEVEKLVGDRNDPESKLKEVFAGRTWDAVIDTSAYFPRQVASMASVLTGAVKQYVFISSVSVYKDMSVPIDEASAVAQLPPGVGTDRASEKITEGNYGPFKALCEQAAQKAFPTGAVVIRPGFIVGPRDPSDRFTYWPVRVARGGQMLVPGTERDPLQVIDVRDLAEWICSMVQSQQSGLFNATGPGGRLTMAELLVTCQALTKSNARFSYLPVDKLKAADLLEAFPIWVPPDMRGMAQVSSARALAKGLRFRPLKQTILDTLTWWNALPAERRQKPRAGLTPEQETAGLRLLSPSKT